MAGIGYLHEQGIIRRDLKPANILFKTDRMGRKVVKITDFGISHDSLTNDNSGSTLGAGTINYMAPEQFLPKTYGFNQSISDRTDMWAFGVIFYRLLTGSLPFKNQEQIIDTEVNLTQVPAPYRALIGKCLQKHADKRYASAKDVIAELDKVKSGAIDKEGNTVIPIQYQDYKFDENAFAENFYFIQDGLMGVKLNDKWGFIDKTGATIISLKYDDIKEFKDGMAAVKLNGKWGFIDKEDDIVVLLKFDSVSVSQNRLSKASLNGKWGFIDKKGNNVIPFAYDEAGDSWRSSMC